MDILAGVRGATVDRPTADETRLLALHPDTPLLRVTIDLNEGAHVRAEELALALMKEKARPPGFIAARSDLQGLRKGVIFDLMAPPALNSVPMTPAPAQVSAAL